MSASPSRLRALREARGLSLAQLAELAGLDKGQLSRVERGIQAPTTRVLARISTVLGIRDLASALETLRRYGART